MTISGNNTVTGLNADSTTNSALYQVEATEVTETSGKSVKVQEKAADGTLTTLYEVKAPSVAKVGNEGYESLAAAITAASAGDTVTLLKDVTLLGAIGSALILANDSARRIYYVCAEDVEFLG